MFSSIWKKNLFLLSLETFFLKQNRIFCKYLWHDYIIIKIISTFFLRLSKSLLPLHTSRTLICILLLLNLLLELYESILTTISLSLILTIIAILFCWILHRETEIKDGFGTAASGGGFAVIGLTRAWKFLYLCRYILLIIIIKIHKFNITNYISIFLSD